VRPTLTPSDPSELGAGLRALRGRTGVRRLAARQPGGRGALIISKSTLDRYEKGMLPPLQYAEHLDKLYEGNGWVEMSIRSLWRSKWEPWSEDHGTARQYHAGRWPAPYGGPVWIKLKPQPEFIGQPHEVDLEWGPWGRHVTSELGESGVVLLTGKAIDIDGISRVCNVTTLPAAYALFGAGEHLSGELVLDVRRGWFKANHAADREEDSYGPSREDA
jgi:hypothetical protein